MSSLILTFEEVYKRVSEFLTGSDIPTDKDLRKVKDITYRGYRKFLYPVNLITKKTHIWQFLIKHLDIITTAGKWVYELPPDFSGKLFYFEHAPSTVYPTLKYVSVQAILKKRKLSDSSSYPACYAIRSGRYDKALGQFYELLLYETPNSNYKLLYSYKFDPPQPTAATDYFTGGVGASEVIIECALAVAELQEKNIVGIHSQRATELVQELILADVDISPDSIGYNLDPNVNRVVQKRYLKPIPESDIYA